jgi:hypothetical protein
MDLTVTLKDEVQITKFEKEQQDGFKEETQRTEKRLSNQDLFEGHSTPHLEKVGSFQRYDP